MHRPYLLISSLSMSMTVKITLAVEIKSLFHSIWNLQTRNMLSLIVIITVLSQASSSQTNELACPEGWERLDSKCYQIVTGKPKTWALARQDCNENGGKLFLPMDQKENEGIYDLYNQRANKIERFWIDVAALDKNSPLLYTTGEGQELSYINWRFNEPDSPNTCVLMGTNFAPPYVWVDKGCNFLYDYVCEKTLKSFKKGTCPFEDNVLFVETSIQKESIEDCQEFCQEIANCEVCIHFSLCNPPK